jgi:hypothetical protein
VTAVQLVVLVVLVLEAGVGDGSGGGPSVIGTAEIVPRPAGMTTSSDVTLAGGAG